MKIKYLLLALALLSGGASCALFKSGAETGKQNAAGAKTPDEGKPSGVQLNDRFGTKYMASEISTNMRKQKMAEIPVVITTFVDLNDLAKTSVFGRMMAEKMIDEMSRQGFHVVEFRRAQDIFIKKDGGEFILTRDVAEIASVTKARAVLAGTYIVTINSIIINARLIDIKSPQVLATVSYEIAVTDEIDSLLRSATP
jgi:TolB-like protein